MFDIEEMQKSEKEKFFPLLFRLLAANMSEIDPTGNTFEQDYQMWKGFMDSGIECAERHIILIKEKGSLVGYFQYRLSETTFVMEEIQLLRAYQGSGAFRELYEYLARKLPRSIQFVEADASKKNWKSQEILKHLGLTVVAENQNGRSFHFRGDCQKMLERYRV